VPPFSVQQREERCRNIKDVLLDVVVVGGGITGCGAARDAALRGLKVALIEKGDLASGTSSRSSRLVHGGLRYLEHFKVGLVHESVSERWRLMRLAPHLVWPVPFLYPGYADSRPGLATIAAGTLLYSALSALRTPGPRRRHDAAQTLREEPCLRPSGLKGAVEYYDCGTHDARLTLENALDAAALGAELFPYAEAVAFGSGGENIEIGVEDRILGTAWTLRTRAVIVAAGPWTDRVLARAVPGTLRWLRLTKGIHIVFPADRLPVRHAVVMAAPSDGRMVFTVPYGDVAFVGTTDTDCPDPEAGLTAERKDVAYLLATANSYFPDLGLSAADVVSTWSGVRPLVSPQLPGEPVDSSRPSDVSREEQYAVLGSRFVVVAGGKLTTYRIMAARAVDRAARIVERSGGPAAARSATAERPLPGGTGMSDVRGCAESLIAAYPGLPPEWLRHLASTYGSRGAQVAAMADADRRLLAPLPCAGPVRLAEAHFAIQHEHAWRPEDFVVRRTRIHMSERDLGREAAAAFCDALVALGVATPAVAGELKAEHRIFADGADRWRTEPDSSVPRP
jgi:glycerol-3-phosphate dehydrogenase